MQLHLVSRRLHASRLAFCWALGLLACALLGWGVLQAGERAGTPAWACNAGPGAPLSAPTLLLASQQQAAAPAMHVTQAVAEARRWPGGLEASTPDADLYASVDIEHDHPEHAPLPAQRHDHLAVASAWTLLSHAGVFLAPQQGLLRPPDLG